MLTKRLFYISDSSIKSVDDHFHVDFQETISDSLAEKFNNIPFVDERILTTVRFVYTNTLPNIFCTNNKQQFHH